MSSFTETSYHETLAPAAPLPRFDGPTTVVRDEGLAVDVATVPGIISLPDCNLYLRCQNCDRGSTSTGIPCPNCGYVNLT